VVLDLADAIELRYRALVLVAGFGGLRLGELLALRRRDVDPLHGSVSVEVQAVELHDGSRLVTAPKTHAGLRTVRLPTAVMAALSEHLMLYASPEPDALVFTGPFGGPLRRATFYKAWDKARRAVGWPVLHLHDLRHAAGTLAAQTGATQRELMARLGHASPAAAQRYQHAAARRDGEIAERLDAVVREARRRTEPRSRDARGIGGPEGA
jgi:integrase